jgi:uncharacterized protein YndB with AHSA1/START domain
MVTINAPIEAVFACLDDEPRQKQWIEGLESIEYLDGARHAVGAKFRERLRDPDGHLSEYQGEIVVYRPPEQLAIRLADADVIVRVDYVLTRERGLTRLYYSARLVHASWLRRFMAFCSGAATRRLRDRQLLALKRYAEQEAGVAEI